MKTFVLTVSKEFPKTHKRAGETTGFLEKLACSLFCPGDCSICHINSETFKKIHTIRSNYELWAKRIEQIQKGEAILSIRYWSGKPYNSPQVKIHELDRDSGIGIQALVFPDKSLFNSTICGPEFPKPTWYKGAIISELSKNDGLSIEDFRIWFKNYDLSKPMAIIHFTPMRY
jgi:hypothetical protein